jgi:uncharacterized protein YgiM (DUF1202 family)
MSTRRRLVLILLSVVLLTAALGPEAQLVSAQGGAQTSEVLISTIANLNLRAAPTTASQRYNIIPSYTVVTASAVSPNYRWIRVMYAGQGGWVYRGYTQVEVGLVSRLPISSEAVPPALISGVVAPGAVIVSPRTDVNLRMEPDPDADIITYVARGSQVSAISVTPGGLWILVQYRGYRGWVNGRYFQVVNGSMTDFSQPTGLTFRSDRDSVTPGECASLSWNVQTAAQVFYQNQGVAATGSRSECPLTTTTYTLRIVTYGNQSLERQVTVTVIGPPPVGNVPGGGTGGTGGPSDIYFSASLINLTPGQCTTLAWSVANAREVYINEIAVASAGSRQECPPVTTSYNLRVVRFDGSQDTRTVTINVSGTTTGPGGLIITFNSTATSITSGQCVTLSWSVSGVQAVFYQGTGVEGTGTRQECPTLTTTYTLSVTKMDGSSEQRQITVTVNGAPPSNITFNATATSITSGQCVTLSWSVSGVQAVFYQGVGVTGTGSTQECPATTTTYTLSVTKLDNSTETRTITINVS